MCSVIILPFAHSEKFIEELKEFGRSYDLAGCGSKHREELIQKRLCTLQDELMLLEAGTCKCI